ncbi:MAG: hypothetical protein EXS36_01180 [Pedosphaera sp.]|nr:hypothetical protein [Pedosphaera sp.]
MNALPQTGGILREYWTNIPGKFVMDLEIDTRFPDQPDDHFRRARGGSPGGEAFSSCSQVVSCSGIAARHSLAVLSQLPETTL